jgi:hypothetical protein
VDGAVCKGPGRAGGSAGRGGGREMIDRAAWAARWGRCPVSNDRCFPRCPIREACGRGLEHHEEAMGRVDAQLVAALSEVARRIDQR